MPRLVAAPQRQLLALHSEIVHRQEEVHTLELKSHPLSSRFRLQASAVLCIGSLTPAQSAAAVCVVVVVDEDARRRGNRLQRISTVHAPQMQVPLMGVLQTETSNVMQRSMLKESDSLMAELRSHCEASS